VISELTIDKSKNVCVSCNFLMQL